MADRLLILDDDPGFADYVATVGKAVGYDVVSITDSTRFDGEVKTWSPTHIVIDLNMPTIDGVEALQILARQRSRAKIVICSGAARDFLDAVNRLGQRFGLLISGVLQKPIRPTELRSFLESLASKNNPALPFGDAFDVGFFDEVCSTMGGAWVANELSNLEARIKSMFEEGHLSSDDREQIARNAHALASAAGMLGFSQLSWLCRELEDACNRDKDFSSLLRQAQDTSRDVCTKAREMMVHVTIGSAN